jgi:hypothetical protein
VLTNQVYERDTTELRRHGLYVALGGYGTHLLVVHAPL